ncbi:H110 protein, partial [Thryothorus ludovicianus]|nr:H110 protein [Thryothorus ludovicianus]
AAVPAGVPGLSAKKPKKAASGSKARKPAGPSVTELITKAVSASKERKGLSLAALKKALAAGGYDVEKNNSRIKLGLKSLVSKGTLVQTKGIGASASFCLSKKPGGAKEKAPKKEKTTADKPKKPATKARQRRQDVGDSKGSQVKPAGKSSKKVTGCQAQESCGSREDPAKVKVVKPKATKTNKAAPK